MSETKLKSPAYLRAILFHQEDGARPLNLAGDFAMKVSRHPGHTAWKDLAALRDKFFQKIRIFIIDCFSRDIDPATRHNSICAAKIGPAFGVFRFHGDYFTSRCKVWRRRKGLYFLFSKRPGVFGLFLFRVLTYRETGLPSAFASVHSKTMISRGITTSLWSR
jgi:hypothetical protein